MAFDSMPAILGLTGFAGLVSLGIVLGLGRWFAPRRVTARALVDAAGPGTVFLFDGRLLVDATPPAQRLLSRKERHLTDWDALLGLLSRGFPDLAQKLRQLDQQGEVTLQAETGSETLHVDYCQGLLRLTLGSGAEGALHVDRLAVAAMEDELTMLRSIAEDAPQLIWKEDVGGVVIWANQTYLNLVERISPPAADADRIWPQKPLLAVPAPLTGADIDAPHMLRMSLMIPGVQAAQWFEVTSVHRLGETIRFAVDANSAVQAESARRDFVQTLTKTSAHLATGLAIFDRQRRLALFNPALLDLTGLPAAFLSSRPLVHSVLDRLRDMHMLPEPKNYTTWREQVAALEAEAAQGTYCETWSLPSGLTYRVTGRPHPEGAIAFLFEDISDEISLTRRFRSEQETAQALLDSLEEGVAVFSAGGTLTMYNAAYGRAWGPTAGGLSDTTIAEELGRWQSRAQPSPIWAKVHALFAAFGDRSPWSGVLHLDDGRPLAFSLTPLSGGATLARFRDLTSEMPLGLAMPLRSDSGLVTEGDSFRSLRRAAQMSAGQRVAATLTAATLTSAKDNGMRDGSGMDGHARDGSVMPGAIVRAPRSAARKRRSASGPSA